MGFNIDSHSVNRKMCDILQKPGIVCKNHLLQSEVVHMYNNTIDLKHCIDSVCATMREYKASIKNIAVLCNITDYKPTLPNITR